MEGIERLSTPRMVAERLTEADYADVRRMHLYPQIMKTLSVDGQPLPDHVTKEGLIQNEAHWRRHGFGLWIFRDRQTRQFLGRAGLQSYSIEGQETVGLVYAVIHDHWNRGLATEMAAASLDIGFRELRLPEVASWTLPDNLASRRVMEKLGFRYDTDIVFAGLPNRLYRLTAIDWELGRGC
ncbi:GNAT family N-acetyltransferase [Aquisphaera insulae]|uniref:GNAT family N-acetyltransferase n=1 Tax=Aquisphaera insulae TaxID=2712864 RepID=UPI0013E9AAE3|nr:GNAT family N-acetyltransferase [Aquisphaera insulae]